MRAVVLAGPGRPAGPGGARPRPGHAHRRHRAGDHDRAVWRGPVPVPRARARASWTGTVLGHEFVGVVESVGSGVATVRVGDRVVSTSTISCGACAHCRAGRSSQCPDRALFGYSGVYQRLDGGQAELVRVPMADRCLKVVPEACLGRGGRVRGGHAADRLQRRPARRPVAGRRGRRGRLRHGRPDGHHLRDARRPDGHRGRRHPGTTRPGGAVRRGRRSTRRRPRPPSPAATGGLGADGVIEAAGSAGALTAALTFARGQGTCPWWAPTSSPTIP